MGTAHGVLDQGLQPRHRQPLQGCQIGPLIGIGLQVVIHEHAATPLPGFLLQRQGDQVAEAPLRHGVLIGEQPVVGAQLQLT